MPANRARNAGDPKGEAKENQSASKRSSPSAELVEPKAKRVEQAPTAKLIEQAIKSRRGQHGCRMQDVGKVLSKFTSARCKEQRAASGRRSFEIG